MIENLYYSAGEQAALEKFSAVGTVLRRAGARPALPNAGNRGMLPPPAAPAAGAGTTPPLVTGTTPPPAAPAAPAAAAATPAKPAGGFMSELKAQAPGALMNTGLMMGLPMVMNAFSGPGNNNPQY